MRLFSRLIAAIVASAALAFTAHAEDISYSIQDLAPSEWNGAEIIVDGSHSVISVGKGGAYAEFDAGGYGAVMLYFDAGNYSGESGGSLALGFLDPDGEPLYETVMPVTVDGSFRRYSFGQDGLYAELPENTAKVRITLRSDGEGPYYKNLTLKLSSTAPRKAGETEWTVSGNTGLVQVKTTAAQYWTLVALIFLVALLMFGVRKILDKTQKNRLIK